MMFTLRVFIIFFGLVMLACADRWQQLEQPLEKAAEEVACDNGGSAAFDVLRLAIEDQGQLPSTKEMAALVQHKIDQVWSSRLREYERVKLSSALLQFYSEILLATSSQQESVNILESLSAFEVGVHDGFVLASHNKKIQNSLQAVVSTARQMGIDCDAQEPPTPVPTPSPLPIKKIDLGVTGRYAMSVAYQSCRALDLKPLSSASASVEGIDVIGTHSSGNGKKREIGDLRDVQNTHPYVRGTSYGGGCFNVSESPLIYDFGGKPYTTSKDNSSFDFFRNGGSGTSALGVDCSGFVFSAIGAAGFKLDPKKVLKASLVGGISARAYMEPAKNGMPCFEKIKVGLSGDLKSGDLIASSGHIVIVDKVGSDPLGVLAKTSASQCSSLDSSDFNFTVSQSSPSKGGVGINRYVASDYLSTNGSFRSALESYARKACEARFKKKDVLIEGLSAQVVRHKQTTECATSVLKFEHAACVENCTNIK